MHCRGCGRNHLQLVLDLGKQPWGNDFIPASENRQSERYPLELFFCHDCSLVQIGYTVPKEKMFVDHNYMSGTTRSLTDHFRTVGAEILSRLNFRANDYILDVGGNDGTFLKYFREKEIGVVNVDSGKRQAEISQGNGIYCVNRFFNEETAKMLLQDKGPALCIHGSGIFFHLEEFHSAFQGIQSLLAKDGILVAEFIYLPQMIERCAFDQIYHEHLTYYTLSTFAGLLSQFGLEPFDCHLSPIHGGSCIAFIGHKGRFARMKTVESRLAWEKENGFLGVDRYLDFAKRTAMLREDLIKTVREVRRQGKSVYALGAPVKGTTIVSYCGWDSGDIQVATEINPYKVGTFVPGTRIPVVHQDSVKPPDVYLLLSWNFKDEILSRFDSFFAAGGQVIIPIPEPDQKPEPIEASHDKRILYASS